MTDNNDKIRVAVCISGQLRTWRKCASTWKKLFTGIKKSTGADQIDVFVHSWDFNTRPHTVLRVEEGNQNVADWLNVEYVPLPQGEREDYITNMSPVKYIFEPASVGKIKFRQLLDYSKPIENDFGEVELAWAASQFYSVMYAAHLKKMYEIENGFRYDICIRMRNDLYFDDHQRNWFLSEESNDFNLPNYNTVYSCHTRQEDGQYPFRRLGDIFWYADSVTFDRICNFYRWLPTIGSKAFIQGEGLPKSTEHALYYYAKMMKMEVYPLSVDPKIYRGAEYLKQKQELGLGDSIGGHELV